MRLALCPIFKLGRPIGARTVGAAEDFSTLLDPMPYNSAPASGTLWRQRMDRAFQAVEDVTLVTYQDFEGLVVVISQTSQLAILILSLGTNRRAFT